MNKKFTVLLSIWILLTLACGSSNELSRQDVEATSKALAFDWLTQTALAIPTNTFTPEATATPISTATETPLPTATQAPIILTGSGDAIVDVPKNADPAVLYARYSGSSNFIVSNFDSNNQQINLLINTIGSYDGKVPLDFLVGEQTARLEVKASGQWEIQILPLSQVRRESIPGNIQGVGDDVIYIDGGNADTITANSTGDSNFIVYSYSDSGIDLVFNEIGAYTGTALLDSTTFMLSIQAEGNWTLDINTR